ncbi:MAG TPA: glycoside hydrolase family 13 protein [Anaerolineae bacterium]|nr:glycoside hydrolase family 13 protein [Anaerolineae bacterium]
MKRYEMLWQFLSRLGLVAALLIGFAVDWISPAPAQAGDNNIQWGEVLHDTFDNAYRSPGGPVTPATTVRLRLRVKQSDIDSARVRVWDDRSNTETYHNMAWDGSFDTDPTTYDWWFVDIPAGAQTTVLYYFFEINDGNDQDFYTDDNPQFYGGGYGAMSDGYNDNKSFQITVYDSAFTVPDWVQGSIVYQVFPDRFRDGNPVNNPPAGRFSYNTSGTIVRSNDAEGDWNSVVCDPRSTYTPSCADKYGDNFYGGDLAGITEKINAGYFDALGVSVLYLNPIFFSPSNHKYDTADFLLIDPDFGTFADFQALTAAAHAHGMKVILDGVFNHTSSDSRYFDRYKRFDASGALVNLSEGADDNSGACESPNSAYRSWFYIPDSGSPATGLTDRCDGNDGDDPGGAWNQTYSAWWGYGSLPKLQANSAAVRALIWDDGLNSVGPYWTYHGADGWRFDVGDDVDPGVTADPTNDYWEGFRAAVRDGGVTGKTDTLLLGEVWGDASGLLLGDEWDSVMNYRFRSAVLGWLFTGCSGNGCTGGALFEDNDSNSGSSSGAISYLNPSQFNARLRSIAEDYPPMAFNAMMNLAGSHDTNRVRFLLKKINNDNDGAALQRMKEWWLFSFTYPGSPTLYYGDEVALSHDGVWANNKWEDAPYNRAPYPWPDATGSAYSPAADTLAFARKMASIRWSYPALQSGDVQHGLVIDDANKLYGFARTTGSQTALIILNRDSAQHTVNLTDLDAAPYNLANGTVLYDAIEGNTYTVSGGMVSVPVNATWGVVLLEQNKIDIPAMPIVTYTENSGPDLLSWPAVITDTTGTRELALAYTIHSGNTSDFPPDTSNQIGAVTLPDFGAPNGVLTFTTTNPASGTYYQVCAYNAAGRSSCGVSDPTAVTVIGAHPDPQLWPFGALLALVGIAILVRRKGLWRTSPCW